jgi:hypothetical protein
MGKSYGWYAHGEYGTETSYLCERCVVDWTPQDSRGRGPEHGYCGVYRPRGAVMRAVREKVLATVWCRTCRATQTVDAMRCMFVEGWPKCCGYTMTIDPPETWPENRDAVIAPARVIAKDRP